MRFEEGDVPMPTLAEFFCAEKITLFSHLPIESVPQRVPRLLSDFPAPRTVVFAAIPYWTADVPGANLARFARVRDYHAFAAGLGAGAAACLGQRYPAARIRAFADHSPFDEVLGAAAAGIGILGDHRLLITEPYSSYVFLFTLVTDLPSAAVTAEGIPEGCGEVRTCEHCGACRRACPGGCTGDDRTSCASAISQKKGELTEREMEILRKSPAAWGCDACADACPHTKAARSAGTIGTEIPYFRDHVLLKITPADVAAMSEEQYKSYAFGWRKKDVLTRNLTIREDES